MTPEEYANKLQEWNAKHEKSLSAMDDWHCRRMSGIGGSEIAAIMGKNKYKTPHNLWLEKTFKVPPFTGNAATLKGQILEDAVAKFYEEATGNKVECDDTHYRSEDAPWLVGNIDRRIVSGGILECKTSRRNPSDDETEDGYQWGMGNEYDEDKNLIAADEQIPLNYYLQVQHYMCLTGAEFADVAVLFLASDFQPFRVYRVNRNEEVIAKIKTAAHDFMQMVLDDVEPAMTEAEIAEQYKDADPSDASVEITDALYQSYRTLKEQIKTLEDSAEEIANKIKSYIKDCGYATVNGKKVISWKCQKATRLSPKTLKEDYPDIYEKCCYEAVTRYFKLVPNGKKGIDFRSK